jgi:hypothetical protein
MSYKCHIFSLINRHTNLKQMSLIILYVSNREESNYWFLCMSETFDWYMFTAMYHFRTVWNMTKIKCFSVHFSYVVSSVAEALVLCNFCCPCDGETFDWHTFGEMHCLENAENKCFPAHISQLGQEQDFCLSSQVKSLVQWICQVW